MSSSPSSDSPRPTVTLADIEDAAKRLSGMAVVTPLLESPPLNKRLGGRLLVKAEPLQRTGSFKFRGAYNRLCRLEGEQKKRGVVAYSSGNHAQGVAAAAQILGMPAVIVMPSDAPGIKIANTKAYGAEVVTYDRYTESREEIGRKIQSQRGAVLVPPFDDPYVIAGQGTAGLEIATQAAAAGAKLDAFLCGASGGGLITGTSIALHAKSPQTKIFVVEPQGFDDIGRSLKSGKRETNDPKARSICDSLLSPSPGEITLPIMVKNLAGGFAVSDDEVRRAMAVAFAELKLVVEPGGAVSLAAILAGKFDIKGTTVAIVCSGGNVDPATFIEALRAA